MAIPAMLDENKHWRVGLMGIASVLCGVPVGPLRPFGPWESLEEMALSALIILLMLPAGLIAMRLTHSRVTRVASLLGSAIYFAA
jgi:hypothetical protein